METSTSEDSENVPQDITQNQREVCAGGDGISTNTKAPVNVDNSSTMTFNTDNSKLADDYIDDYTDLLIVDLPEVVLVKIMHFLNLKERYYLSMTCKLFYDLFIHPHLWQIAHIDLFHAGISTTKNYSRWKLKCVMNSTMAELVKRFSHIFQHLFLKMDAEIQRFDDISAKLLEELIHDCRLESLSLKLGPLTSDVADVRRLMARRSNAKDVPLVVGLIHNATRLKRLNIISWPLFTDMEDSNILLAIQSNEKLKILDSLSLFFIDVKKQTWTERIPKLPSAEQTLNVISFLSNLTHLALRSPMINDETIILLASHGRMRLEVLQILVMFANPSSHHDGFKIPEIASSSWQKLSKVSTHLHVEFVVLTRIPWEQLGVLLKPEVPLSSLSLLNYSQCDSLLLECIASHYKMTLKSLKSLCDSSYCDNALLMLVEGCRNLTSLAYHGDIHYKTVMRIAELLKPEKDKWDLFQFKEKNIKTNSLEEDDDDDDAVVKFDAVNQNYYLGGINAWHIDEDVHQKKLDEMIEHVRNCFGTTSTLFAAQK